VSFALSDCARARESVSVQLDGELPELELDRLETHLRFCPACAAWAENVRDVTRRLREAAFEEPAEVFALPRRSRRWAVSSAVALASAAAVVATLFVAPGRQNASLGALNRPRSLATYDVATQPHPVDFLIPGASSSVTAQWPVRPL
jgi:predicted anti-sigma-YlaC factor YlaD